MIKNNYPALFRYFLQAFCIHLTALFCQEKSSDYVLMKFDCELTRWIMDAHSFCKENKHYDIKS